MLGNIRPFSEFLVTVETPFLPTTPFACPNDAFHLHVFWHQVFEINVLVKRAFTIAIIHAVLFAVSIPPAGTMWRNINLSDGLHKGALLVILSCFFGPRTMLKPFLSTRT